LRAPFVGNMRRSPGGDGPVAMPARWAKTESLPMIEVEEKTVKDALVVIKGSHPNAIRLARNSAPQLHLLHLRKT